MKTVLLLLAAVAELHGWVEQLNVPAVSAQEGP